MLSIDIIHIWRLSGNRKKTLWVDLEANSWRLMVNALHWGVIFQIHHMVEKIWWWGMITNGLKSPKDLFLEARNQNMGRYEGYVYSVTLPYNV